MAKEQQGIGVPTNPNPLAIVKIEVPDPEYVSEIPEHMKNNHFPGFPSTTLICGPPGKGKTNLLMNLLTKKNMWRGFFDEIHAFGPTVKSDKLYKTIKLQEKNICEDVKKIIPTLEQVLEEQTKKVKENPNEAPKLLFIFEDMTSFFNTVQHKPPFHRCYTQCRHVKGASITMVHKYHAFHRTPRTSSQHIIIFETNVKDISHVHDEFGPRNMNLKDFMVMVNYALTPTEDNPKPFFYINTMVPEKIRYRKSFVEILVLADQLPLSIGSSEPKPSHKKKNPYPRRRRSMSPTERGKTEQAQKKTRDRE